MSSILGALRESAARRPTAMRRYLAVVVTAMALMPLALSSQWGQTGVTVLVGYASAFVCVSRYRSGRGVPAAWAWIGAGLALNSSGRVWELVAEQVFKSTATPSGADLLYLAIFPCATVGLLKIVRSRYPGLGPAKLIDASTLTVGTGLLCWVFLIRPSAADASGSALAQVAQVAYPLGDLMLLVILARVAAAEGWRTPSVRLMCLALLAFLLGDSGWALVNANDWVVGATTEALLTEPSLAAYVLFGAAALHRSAEQLDHPAADTDERMSRGLLASLAIASLIAPALLAGQALLGRVTDGVAIALCSAQLTALVIARMAFLLRHLQRQSVRLRELALEDPLTGLPNRRSLDAYLGEALQRARRERHPVSVAMIDLDHFKRFNDEYGHPAGDHLLKSAAAAWGLQIRSTDLLARIGGEEFVLVLPDADLARAETVLEGLRAGTPLSQTFSAGLSCGDGDAQAGDLLAQADSAMYDAKRAGRDRVHRASSSLRV